MSSNRLTSRNIRTPRIALAVLLSAGALLTPAARAQTPAPQPAAPVVADADGTITIDAQAVPLSQLLHDLATQAKWDLALSASNSVLQTPITLRVKQRSAEEVLERLRELSGLSLELRGGFLTVSERHGDRDDRREGKRRGKRKPGKDDRVLIGQAITIQSHETVDDAVAIGAPLRVDGHVRGDASAVGGSVTLGPTAVVDGDAVAIGGPLEIEPGAQLRGSQVSLPNPIFGLTRWVSDPKHAGSRWNSQMPDFPSGLFTLFRGLCLLLLGVLLLSFVPQRVNTITATLSSRPWLSLGLGFCLMIGLLPACLLLAITLIGIPLIPIAIALVLALLWVGAIAVAARVGSGLPGSERRSLLLNFAIGALLVSLVDLIPWVGTPLIFLLAMAGAGATLVSRLGTRAQPPSAAPPPPEAPTSMAEPLPG